MVKVTCLSFEVSLLRLMFSTSLNDALSATALGAETAVQLVFFHPKFQFRDGQARSGEAQGK